MFDYSDTRWLFQIDFSSFFGLLLFSNRSTYVLHEFLLYMSKQILSRDSVTVAVDAVVYYRVQNPTIAVSNVENFR